MEVTYGLLSNLVKTKSIQRVLAPIASQISLLIILHESELKGEGGGAPSKMATCATSVMEAAETLTVVAKHRADTSPDQDFRAQMGGACEILDLASGNLCIAAQRLEVEYTNQEARSKLIQSAKDVLQGTMKVLLVSDDAEVRRLIAAANLVTEKVDILNKVTSMTDLLANFKSFTDAATLLTSLANKRQKDLTMGRQREKILTSLNMLKKSVPAISIALQNFIKYPSNTQAETSKSYVTGQVKDAVEDIVDAVQNKLTEGDDLDMDEASSFVSKIDQAMDALSEDSRLQLNPDLESWTESVVRHSMAVAHMCSDAYRDLIIKTCGRLLQVQTRVVQLYPSMKSNPELPKLGEDYDDVCETLTDEFCELEKDVNIALLYLVVDIFKETTEPIETLVKAALHRADVDNFEEFHRELIAHFQDHSEKLCQVAMFAAASSTDVRRVRKIRHSAHRLEKLDPEILPAVFSLVKEPHNKLTVRHIKLLTKEWMFEMSNVLQLLDEMTDPRMFMIVSERKIAEDINTCRGCILILEPGQLDIVLKGALGRARRITQVAERIIDSHDDPVFRNGLLTLVKQLMKAIAAVKTTGNNVAKNLTNKAAVEALKTRFDLLLDAVKQVGAGLSNINHPNLLSPLRKTARRPVVEDEYSRSVKPKSEKLRFETPKPSSIPQLSDSEKETDRQFMVEVPDSYHLSDIDFINETSDEDVLKTQLASEEVGSKQPALKEVMKKSPLFGDEDISRNLVTGSHTTRTTGIGGSSCPKDIKMKLISAAMKGEKPVVNSLCGDLLGWTNHIVDAAHSVALHCFIENRKSEMQNLSFDADQLIPQVIEKSKLVALGDTEELEVMKTLLSEWCTKIEKLRFLIDLTVERWMDPAERICDVALSKNKDFVKVEVDCLKEHQHEISKLVILTEGMKSENLPSCHEKLVLLREQKNDLENITVTIASTAEMFLLSGMKEERSQLEQLGREWAVLMYCMVFNLDSLVQEVYAIGQEQQLWYQADEKDPLLYLQKQNERYRVMLRAVCQGENQGGISTSVPKEMQELFYDIKTISQGQPFPSHPVKSSAVVYFRPKKLSLTKALWIMKGLEGLRLIKEQCALFFQPLDCLIQVANSIRQATTEIERSTKRSEFQMVISKFSEDFTVLRQKLLNRLQMSVELSKRGTVRQCLDDLTALSPKAIDVIKNFAASADYGDECQIRNFEWSTKAKQMVSTLEQMADMRAYVSDTKKFLTSKICLGKKIQAEKAVLQPSTSVNTQQSAYNTTNHTIVQADTEGKTLPQYNIFQQQSMKIPDRLFPLEKNWNENIRMGADVPLDIANPNQQLPPTKQHYHNSDYPTGMTGHRLQPTLESQRKFTKEGALNLEQQSKPQFYTVSEEISSLNRPDDDAVLLPSSLKRMNMAEIDLEYDPSTSVLAAARYLEREADRWEDENNPIVQVAKEMTQQMEIMSEHCVGEGTLMGHNQMIEIAKAAALNGQKILRFAEILAEHCVDKRFADDLMFYAGQIPMISTQLNILATVQMTSPEERTAEKVLVLNAQNLMKIVVQTVHAAEAVCVKGLHPPLEGQLDEMNVYLLATQWKEKLSQYRNKESLDAEIDELGLRRIEEDTPPTLTQIFQTS